MLHGELRSRRLHSVARLPAVSTPYWYFSCRSEPALVLFSTPYRRHAVPPSLALDPSLPTTLFRIGHWSGFKITATYSLLFMFNALIAFDSNIIKCASSFTSPSIPHRKQRNEIKKFIKKTLKKDISVFYVFYWLWNIKKKHFEIFQIKYFRLTSLATACSHSSVFAHVICCYSSIATTWLCITAYH